MKILADRRNRLLLTKILLCILTFLALSGGLLLLKPDQGALLIFLCSLGMGLLILAVCVRYLQEQNKIMEHAVAQIADYGSGNREVRIACCEEGELYRLFHEVNSLAAILDAHAENERRAKEFLKNIISDISHQLKTPLTALNIYNGLLKGEAEELPAVREFAELSEQELDRIETLVQNLLKIAKLDAGSIVLEKTSENVENIMHDLELHFAYRAGQEGKEIVLSGAGDVSLSCDRDWLMEALDNLVKNALDHTDRGDVIRICWEQSGSSVRIQVKDNGRGIHPEDLYHIFKRFYRSRFSKDKQGIGLGLPLAKVIVEAHNGTIEVDSELGIGTTFTIHFLIPTKL